MVARIECNLECWCEWQSFGHWMRAASIIVYGSTVLLCELYARIHAASSFGIQYWIFPFIFYFFRWSGAGCENRTVILSIGGCVCDVGRPQCSQCTKYKRQQNVIFSLFAHIIIIIIGLAPRVYMYFVKFVITIYGKHGLWNGMLGCWVGKFCTLKGRSSFLWNLN